MVWSEDWRRMCEGYGEVERVERERVLEELKWRVFGGYNPVEWTSRGTYVCNATATIFTLKNPHGISPTCYVCIQPSFSCSDYGPCFGGSPITKVRRSLRADIGIVDGCNATNTSNISFPNSYTDTTGRSSSTFTGEQNFTVAEVEVWRLMSAK